MNRKNTTSLIKKFQNDPASYEELRTALQIIGDKWSVLILLCIFNESTRFSDIAAYLPDLNPRTLTAKLRNLESAGLITRHKYKEFPPRIEYALTEKAFDLKNSFAELVKWAKKYCK